MTLSDATDKSAADTDAEVAVELTIDYFTDPLCCWSWGFEPQWRRLLYEFGGQIRWRYIMGGMIRDWTSFNDPFNGVTRPAQMSNHWQQVGRMTGQPLDEQIWQADAPTSSLPAGSAVKAAVRQGESQVERYLRRLREAAMLEGRNIARRSVLTELAIDLASVDEADDPLDLERFLTDLRSDEVDADFREDLRLVGEERIERFPTLLLRSSEPSPRLIVGYRPYQVLLAALEETAPALRPRRIATDALEYVRYWGGATAREVAEALDVEVQTARRRLDAAVEVGDLHRRGEMLYVASSETFAGQADDEDDEEPQPAEV